MANIEDNTDRAVQLFTVLFPGLEPDPTILMEAIKIVGYIQTTQVNPAILPRVIRGIHNLMLGSGRGQVVIHVQGTMTNVSVKETDEELKTRL